MKKIMYFVVVMTSAAILQCCSTDDPISDFYDNNSSYNGSSSIATDGNTATGSSELTTFDVAIDQTTAEPASTVAEYFPDSEDDLSNNSFTTEVSIDLSNPTAKTENGVTITVNGGHVTANHGSTKSVCYVVSGSTSNGSFTVVGDKKYEVKLNNVSITNPDSAALNLLSSKRAYVVLNGNSTLTDGTSSLNDHKGTLYCKGKLLLNGTGSIKVTGNYNNAIHCADYIVTRSGINIYAKSTANHGVKANDGIYINGGILNVEVSAAAAKGINCEADIMVNGGRTTVIATGGGAVEDGEAKGAAAIKCDSTYTQNGGEVYLKATGTGGKGLKADWEGYINGGTLKIVTTGSTYSYNRDTASPKGIKIGTKNVHGVLDINGGTVMVRTSGAGGEGIESKGTLSINDGTVQVSAYDDAINSASHLYIKGGAITAVGTSNDGLDANGNMYISGGTIVAFGAGGAETGIDIGEQYKLYITGGYIFGIGGRIDASIGSTSQGVVSTSGSVTGNSTVTVSNGSATIATFAMPPYNYSNGTIMVSAPDMASGTSYTLNLGSSSQTVTASNSVSGSMGGGMPGGRR
ncbi:MAG: carbohydrate-binding domain-containing protein [Prevotella sp.]|nr:carbohydrate-binding domain-containing protein [Prevotella sp.]